MAGLFDGAFDPIGSGILPAWAMTRDQPTQPDMPPWLTNMLANVQQGGMPGQPAPQFPQGMNFNDRFALASSGGRDMGLVGGPPLQEVSPQAMAAWRQSVAPGGDNGGIVPTTTPLDANGRPVGESAALPPNARPAMGQPPQPPQQGGAMPSALSGMPIPQMPAMPSFGSMLGIGSAQAQPASSGGPAAASPGPLDRLGAGLAGFANSGGVLPAIANLIGGIATGQRQDPEGYARTQTTQMQAQTYQALRQAGVPEGQAQAAALNPEVFKAVAAEHFGGPKIVQIGEDQFGGKQFGVQVGGKLVPLDQFMAASARSGGNAPAGGDVVAASGDVPGQGSSFLAKGVKAMNPELSGPDYLNQFSPEVQAAVKAYVNGESMPTGNPRKGFTQTIKMLAQKYGNDIGVPADDTSFAQRRKMRTDLAGSSPGTIGGILSNGLSAFKHLGELGDAMVDLGNFSGPNIPGGAHIGTVGNVIGNVVAPTPKTAGKIVAVNDAALKYGQEGTKFYAGTGGGEAERMAALKTAKAQTATGEEQAAFLEMEKKLMMDRLIEKENQVRQIMGEDYLAKHPVRPKDFDKTVAKIDTSIAQLRGEVPAKMAVKESVPKDVATPPNVPTFASPADVTAAVKSGKLKSGDSFMTGDGRLKMVP